MTQPTDPLDLPIFGGSPSTAGEGDTGTEQAADRVVHPLATPVARHTPTMRPAPPAATSPTDIPGLPQAERATLQRKANAAPSIDWAQVAIFRSQASDQLTSALGEDRQVDRATEEELGRAIIQELLQSEASERLSNGDAPWSLAEQDAMAQAVFDALFGLGRLQPLVNDETLENILVLGCDNVWADCIDGSKERLAPVADSDAELIDFLQFLDSRSGNPRHFSPSNPTLNMKLDGGARLAATAWVTDRPKVVIRRHGLRKVSLQDLVERDMISDLQATLLAAAVKSGLSIVVAGPQGAGKTTLARALCAEIPPWEVIGTFETEYELFLHELPEQHPLVIPWEERPGSGEYLPNGQQAGAFSIDKALYNSYRFFLSRQIVGEVRGFEVWPMIKAMESGTGSISTTHGASASDTLQKLISCATETGFVTTEVATDKIARTVDLVVQVHLVNTPAGEGQKWHRRRWVSEIVAVEQGEDNGFALTHVFRPNPAGGPGIPGTLPDHMRELEQFGFDLESYLERQGEIDDGNDSWGVRAG